MITVSVSSPLIASSMVSSTHPSLSFTSNNIIIIMHIDTQHPSTYQYIYLTFLLLRNPLQKSIISTQFLTIGLKTAAFRSSGQNLCEEVFYRECFTGFLKGPLTLILGRA